MPCTPIKNFARPLAPVLLGRRGAALGFRRSSDWPRAGDIAPAATDWVANNENVCSLLIKQKYMIYGGGTNLAAPWEPGEEGRIVLTVSNVNSVLDDSWDFKINGVTVCNYDGGGATTVSFSTDLPPGLVLDLTAECVGEQNDNFFSVTVTVDGIAVIETDISGDGTVGEVQDLGSFTT